MSYPSPVSSSQIFLILLLLPLLLFSFHTQVSAEEPTVESFSFTPGPDGLPPGWVPLNFPKIKRHTTYSVVSEAGESFLKAEAVSSASGLYKVVEVDLKKHPIVRWRWKVEGIIKKGDASTKAGDDYAARLYISFAHVPEETGFIDSLKYMAVKAIYGQEPPGTAINYIWANKLKKGSAVPNSYTEKAMMIAVESGAELVGEWVTEERNVYEDYLKLFHHEPPPILFIAVMTDTDNTGESAVAYYDDIGFMGR